MNLLIRKEDYLNQNKHKRNRYIPKLSDKQKHVNNIKNRDVSRNLLLKRCIKAYNEVKDLGFNDKMFCEYLAEQTIFHDTFQAKMFFDSYKDIIINN